MPPRLHLLLCLWSGGSQVLVLFSDILINEKLSKEAQLGSNKLTKPPLNLGKQSCLGALAWQSHLETQLFVPVQLKRERVGSAKWPSVLNLSGSTAFSFCAFLLSSPPQQPEIPQWLCLHPTTKTVKDLTQLMLFIYLFWPCWGFTALRAFL